MNIFLIFLIFLLFKGLNSFLCTNYFNKTCINLKKKLLNINMNLNSIQNKNKLPLYSKIDVKSINSNTKILLTQLKKDFDELETKMNKES